MWVTVLQLVLKVIELTCLPSKRGPLFSTCPKWYAGRKHITYCWVTSSFACCSWPQCSQPPLTMGLPTIHGWLHICLHSQILDYHHSAAACGEALSLSLTVNRSLSFSHDQLMAQCSSPVLSPSQGAPVPQKAWVRMSSNIALQYQTTHSDPPSWVSVLLLCNWLLSHNTDQPQLCLYMSDSQVV